MDINIAYWANEKFSKYTYFSILSLLRHSDNNDIINCFLFTEKNNNWVKYIKDLEKVFSNFRFKEYNGDEGKIKNLKTSKTITHLNYNTYWRFFIDQLSWIKKIVYLDSDTIIIEDIKNLFKEDIEPYVVWIVSDSPIELIQNIKKEIKFQWEKYFNSWVMLINLREWKNQKISSKCLTLLKDNSFPTNDQDTLNITLEWNCKYLDWKYNVQTSFFWLNYENFKKIGFWIEYYKEAINHPFIIHFTWTYKPWNLLDNHPYRWEYDKTVLTAIFLNLKQFKLLPISFYDYLVTLLHTIEHILFPKQSTKKKVRKYIWIFIRYIKRKI